MVLSQYGDPRWLWVFFAAAAGAGAFAGVALAQAWRHMREARERYREQVVLPDMTSPVLKAFLPLARGLGLAGRGFFGRGSVYAHFLETVNRKLSSAGRPQGINADEFVGFAWVWGFLGAGAGLAAYLGTVPNTVGPAWGYVGGLAALAAFAWWRWLATRQAAYQNAVRRDLPFCLDLLTLSMEAGLDFTAALARLARKISGTPLGREFGLLYREIQFGKGRTQALRDFARRVDVAEVSSLVASLIQAEELGASLGPILRILAAQQRERRSQRAEEQAMKAPVKILFPLVVCIFPCIMIVLLGPIGLTLWERGW